MATTTRLLLYKPVGGDLVNPVVANNDQMSIIDSKACKTLVTVEASPPVAEFPGQEWFTKDTKKFFYADSGLVWQEISLSTGSTPGVGRLAFNKAADSTGSTFLTTENQENGPQVHAEVNVVNGNKYIVYCNVHMFGSGTQSPYNVCFLRLRVSSGASVVTTSGTLFHECHGDYSDDVPASASQCDKFVIGFWTANFTGAASFGLFLHKPSGASGTARFERTTGASQTFQFIAIEEVST